MKQLNLLFIGPPGSGKGTQAELIKQKFGQVCHLATGDLLREAISHQTDLGKKVKPIVDSGDLVPDDLMVKLVEEKLALPECNDGFILDGFPRTSGQAEALNQMLFTKKQKVEKAFEFQIDDEKLVSRITGRLVHLPSGRVYHKQFKPPKQPMKDDVTGEPLVQRSDDNEATLRRRLRIYHETSSPLLTYYRRANVWIPLDATKPSAEVHKKIMESLESFKSKSTRPPRTALYHPRGLSLHSLVPVTP